MILWKWTKRREAIIAILSAIENNESIYCLEVLGVNVRHLSALDNQGIFLLSQLIERTPQEIQLIYNGVGHIAIKEIKSALNNYEKFTPELEGEFVSKLYTDTWEFSY